MKRLSTGIVVLLVALAAMHSLAASNAAPQTATPDTVMLFAAQADDPVRIVQANFSADNSLIDALLENKSHQKIQSYRLSWVVIKKEDIRLAKGISVEVPKELDKSASISTPRPAHSAHDEK